MGLVKTLFIFFILLRFYNSYSQGIGSFSASNSVSKDSAQKILDQELKKTDDWDVDSGLVFFAFKMGADINTKGRNGGNAFDWATGIHDSSVFAKLVKIGINVNTKDSWGDIPLQMAANFGDFAIAKILIDNGSDINSRGRNGTTPLINACYHGRQVAELLVSKGANVNYSDSEQFTPLHLAKDTLILKILLNHGAIVDARDLNGNTPLQYAAGDNNIGKVRLLIRYGADINAINKKGSTPIDVAMQSSNYEAQYNNNDEVINYLKSIGGKSGNELPKNKTKK